jgi:alpha-amylase
LKKFSLTITSYYWITQAFQATNGSIINLVNGVNVMKTLCSDTTLLGSFSENHDLPRFASLTSDMSQAKNVIAFTMLADGIPIIYAGQEQHYAGGAAPFSREATWLSGYNTAAPLYTWVTALNKLRSRAIFKDSNFLSYKAWPVYHDSSTIVMRKGFDNFQIIAVFSNMGSGGSNYTLTLSSSVTGFTANDPVVEVMSCTPYTTDSSGNLAVPMASGLPQIFYPSTQLTSSGICSSVVG